MAFPNDIIDFSFKQAQDPQTTEDINNIIEYQNKLSAGDFSGAQAFLASLSNGIAMNLNAGRFNEVINLVNEIENFYKNNIAGVKAYINNNINAYSDISKWSNSTRYNVGNIAQYQDRWYRCIQNHTNKEPTVSTDWKSYWEIFIKNQKQYPISVSQPTNQQAGDIWFQIIE